MYNLKQKPTNKELIKPNKIIQFMLLLFFSCSIAYQSSACDSNIENPLELSWLADKIAASIGDKVNNIKQSQFEEKTYFAISDNYSFGCMSTVYENAIDPLPITTSYYDCLGNLICKDDCEESFLLKFYKNDKLVWNYCEYACKYETKGTVKYSASKGCEFYIETKQGDKLSVQDIYTDFTFKIGQQIEFSYHKDYSPQLCTNGNNIEINCIREIESMQNCKIPESKIISNPVICGRGIVNLETDFDTENENFTYAFVKVNKADDSFEILTNTSIADDSACYYGIAYSETCDVPNFNATSFSELLNANANYTITDCFEIERAEAPGYIITTEPVCISADLFTVGITLSGASGNYIIGEDYTGNEVKGVEGENFITLKSGQEFYNFLPRDAVTGCTNDFGLAVKDPGCGCICPAVVSPVCGVDGESYGNRCLAACAGVEIDYVGACNALPKIFSTYEWLNKYINPNSCEAGLQIDVYKVGLYNFVHVQYATGIDLMYFESGEVICETGDRASCLNYFNFGEPVDTWQCERPILINPFFFENYDWLNPMVDINNCEGTTIKQYEKRNHQYILVETKTVCNLYYQNGFLFCTDEDASICLEKFNLTEPTKVWTCEEGGNKTTVSITGELFNIFPNPSKGEFTVELLETDSNLKKLHVLDIHGKIIQTHKLSNKQKIISLGLTDIPGGVYWIQLDSSIGSSTKKIIIH